MFTFRAAQPSDFDEICDVYLAAWKATYKGVLPQARYDEVDLAYMQGRMRDDFDRLNDRLIRLLVAVADHRIVGLVRTATTNSEPPLLEVARLVVPPNDQNQGIGSMLLEAALRIGQKQGFESAVLWEVDNHAAARRFYEARGWRLNGVETERTGDGYSVTEVQYSLDLLVGEVQLASSR